ncbi:MAG: DMT family transporter [Hellea sp.]|nr:DMT family transporter [Hellea sp.]
MAQAQTYHWTGPLTVLAGGFCIGFAPIMMRFAEADLGPQAIAMWRFFFAVPILFLIVIATMKRLPVRPNKFIILGGIFFASDIALWHWSLSLTTVANATFIVNLGNIGVGLLAWIFLKERLTIFWVMAIAMALTGAAALSQGGVEAAIQPDVKGDILALIAACFLSAYILCSKIARRTISAVEAMFWLTLVELFMSIIFVKISGEAFFPKSSAGYFWPFMLAIVVQILGQGLIVTGLGKTPASIAGVMILLQPVVATIAAWGFFGEHLSNFQIGGGLLILLAIWLAQQGRAKQPS